MAEQISQEFGNDDFTTAEGLDEDELKLDPLEEGMDPPEHWKAADKFGTTANEQREGQDLTHRLAEEQPDVQPDEHADQPVANLPDDELDETIDDRTYDREPVGPQDELDEVVPQGERRGQSSEEAGGSVADEIRTPPPA